MSSDDREAVRLRRSRGASWNRRAPARAVVGWLIALALSMAACGGSSGPSARATTSAGTAATTAGRTAASAGPTMPSGAGAAVPACSLLTNEEIKEISGFTVAASSDKDVDIDFTATSGCAWTFEGNIWKLIVGVTTPAGDRYDRTFQLEGGKQISGLGDRAFRGSASNVVFAQAGDTLVTLLFIGAGIPDSVDEALITRALARLR